MVTIIDDFETGTLDSAWSQTTSGVWSVETDPSYEGTYGLWNDGSSASYIYSNEGDGLGQYFSRGQTFNLWKYTQWASFRITQLYGLLGVPGSDDWYTAQWDPSNGTLELRVYENGSQTNSYSTSAPDSTAGTWYDFEIQWADDDTHTITITEDSGTEVASLTATDATHAGNAGIGAWWPTHSSDTYGSDYWRITAGDLVQVTGTVQLDDGTALENATIIGYNDTQGLVEDVTTTAADGTYTLEMSPGDTAHVMMEYDDGTDQYNAQSKPFVVLE